jgi:hypothetical protein
MTNREAVAIAPPAAGWVLISKRRLTCAGIIYPPGSVVPPEALGRNFRSLLDTRAVIWQPASKAGPVKPFDAPPPPPPAKPNPQIVLIADTDPVAAWHKSLAAMTVAYDGDAGRACDRLLHDNAGSRLYQTAVRLDAARKSSADGPGRRIARL